MVYTALQLITESMREIGAIAINEPLEAHEVTIAMTRLNGMLGLMGVDGLMIRATILENFPLAVGIPSYTIGATGVFVTSKPYRIISAYVRDANNQDTPLDVISRNEYDAIQDKIINSGPPEKLCYDPGVTQQAAQLGTVLINPPPDIVYALYINSDKALTEIAAPATVITFEPVYYEFLMYNLAKRLWSSYHDAGQPLRPEIAMFATQARKAIETLNSRNVVSRTDLPESVGGRYNIYTDQ